MNLAFITKKYDVLGGTERDLYELTRRLASMGHDVHVYCQMQKLDPADGVALHLVPGGQWIRFVRARLLASQGPSLARRGNHDLVISYARVYEQDIIRCGGGSHKVYLERLRRNRLPLRKRIDPYHRALVAIERKQYDRHNFRSVQAISKVVKKEIQDAYNVPDEAISIVYDGVDTEAFHPKLKNVHASKIRGQYNISRESTVALFVGNAFERKGLQTALRALASAPNSDVHLLVVGTDAKRSQFEKEAHRLGLSNRVHFTGAHRDVTPYYGASDMLLLPSIHEAFGNVTLEAIASGLPAVVSAASGSAEILDGELADWILHDSRNAEELARLIQGLCNPEIRVRLSSQARAVAERFNLDSHARHVEEHYLAVRRAMSGGRA